MAAIVIADASPLIALARVGGLSWLQQLFTEVMLTDVVLAEVLTGRYPDTEAPIRQALAADKVADKKGIPGQLLRAKLHLQLSDSLDPGLALQYAIAARINSPADHRDAHVHRLLALAYLRNGQWAESFSAAVSALTTR